MSIHVVCDYGAGCSRVSQKGQRRKTRHIANQSGRLSRPLSRHLGSNRRPRQTDAGYNRRRPAEKRPSPRCRHLLHCLAQRLFGQNEKPLYCRCQQCPGQRPHFLVHRRRQHTQPPVQLPIHLGGRTKIAANEDSRSHRCRIR